MMYLQIRVHEFFHEMEHVDTERRSSARIEEGWSSSSADGDEGGSDSGGHAVPSPLAQGANPFAMNSVLPETPTATTTTLWALVVRSSYSK